MSNMFSSASSCTKVCCFSRERSFLMNPGSAETALKNEYMAVEYAKINTECVNSNCEVAIKNIKYSVSVAAKIKLTS